MADISKEARRRTPAQMVTLKDAIYEIAEAQEPVTLRTVFYVMADRGLVTKSGDQGKADYHNVVVRLAGKLRRAGDLPFEWIIDPTRWVDSPLTFSTVRGGLEYFRDHYRQTLEPAFNAHVQLWVESRSSGPELAPVTHDLTCLSSVPAATPASPSSTTPRS